MIEPFPPTDGTPDLPPVPPSWPKVIGIISIIWGSLGLVCGGCGMAMPIMMGAFMGGQGQTLPPSMTLNPPQLIVTAIGMVGSILLIAAGVSTVSRKPVGSMLHIAYALLSVPISLLATYFAWKSQGQMAQWVLDNPSNPMAQAMSSPGQQAGQMIGLAFGVLLGLAYPIFCLVWFGIVKKPSEIGGPPSMQD